MTKRLISAVLALAMLLSMTACGQDTTSEPTKNSISVSDSSQVNTESENSSESDTGSSSDSESENSTDDNSVVTSKTTSTTSDATVTKNSNTPKATTTTKTSESNAGTTTTPAITTTDASITRIATEITVPQTTTSKAATTTRTTTKATTRATTQATQKPVVTTTTKATTKPVTTTTKTTTAKPSSDKIIYEVKYKTKYGDYTYVTETQSRHAICEKGIASMAAEINKIRKANGLNTLKVNPLLTKAAMIRARELAETYVKYGGISHTRPNGKQASSVIWEVGYDGNAFENAYYAFDWIDWKECLRVWLNSPDHKRNILDKGHEVMGLAIINVTVRNEYMRTGSQRTFAIQLFD